MSNTGTVREIYEAFGRGDVPAILNNRERNYSFPNNGHLWQFNPAGKVTRYDHITDTAQMIRMAKGE